MPQVSTAAIKELRSATGAGLSDCKKALAESHGDMAEAQNWLRARGAAIAGKKAGRETTEGAIAFAANGSKGVLMEVLSETDFVASNEEFRNLAQRAAQAVAEHSGDIDEVGSLPAGDSTLEDLRNEATLKIGENIKLGRTRTLDCTGGLFHYIHHNAKIGVIADITCPADSEVGKLVCMQIAAYRPEVIAADEFDPAELAELEKTFGAETEGKPPEIAAKITAGKIEKFKAERSLLSLSFIKDDKISVGDYLKSNDSKVNAFEFLAIG